MESNETYYSPGGGLLKLNRDLTNAERKDYMRYFASKGIAVAPENIVVEDGRVVIKEWSVAR